jgi:hypothetical protein
MLAFPGMIARHAEKAGMKIPKDPDKKWDFQKYLHFGVFCALTLGRPLRWGTTAIQENADIIAAIPLEELKRLTLEQVQGKLAELV